MSSVYLGPSVGTATVNPTFDTLSVTSGLTTISGSGGDFDGDPAALQVSTDFSNGAQIVVSDSRDTLLEHFGTIGASSNGAFVITANTPAAGSGAIDYSASAGFAGNSSWQIVATDGLEISGAGLNLSTAGAKITTASNYRLSVLDVGNAHVDWATVTSSATPSVVIAPPAGGTTISVQATTYKSSDGSSGVTAGPFTTISSITVKNGLVTALTGS